MKKNTLEKLRVILPLIILSCIVASFFGWQTTMFMGIAYISIFIIFIITLIDIGATCKSFFEANAQRKRYQYIVDAFQKNKKYVAPYVFMCCVIFFLLAKDAFNEETFVPIMCLFAVYILSFVNELLCRTLEIIKSEKEAL